MEKAFSNPIEWDQLPLALQIKISVLAALSVQGAPVELNFTCTGVQRLDTGKISRAVAAEPGPTHISQGFITIGQHHSENL